MRDKYQCAHTHEHPVDIVINLPTKTGRIDDRATFAKTFTWILRIVAHSLNSVLDGVE